MADGADLAQGVGDREERRRAREGFAAEVDAQAVGHHRDPEVVGHARELPDLRGLEELGLVDEAQFLQPAQVWQLARVADDLGVPVMAYGLRVDFRGEPFPGSAALLAIADSLREIRTICHCGRKATMVVRRDESGRVVTDGDQVQIGGDETYVSLCRIHWREAFHGAPD